MLKKTCLGVAVAASMTWMGCGSDSKAPATQIVSQSLANRAYVVSLESDELSIFDLDKLEVIAKVPTGGVENHMAELSADGLKSYVSSSHTGEIIVVDNLNFKVIKRIPVGHHNSHVSVSPDGKLLAVMLEDDNAVAFVDLEKDELVKTLPGFFTPHFMRFTPNGEHSYVANIGANHITRVNMKTLEIEGHVALDGFDVPPYATLAPEEGGFADVQIASDGVLYAAHHATGRVLAYDTSAQQKLPEIAVGKGPWVVFAEHPFPQLPARHLVPNFLDSTVSLINGVSRTVQAALPGDEEAYGVNYSSLTPNQAFVMNRIRQDIAVMDTENGTVLERIPVGGNTETAATTADGKLIIAAVSGANKVIALDPVTHKVVKDFTDVGIYPWSVTIPGGQNYCH